MAKTSDSIVVDMSPEDTWKFASDLSRFEDWLVLHDGWRSELPAPGDLKAGTKVSSVIKLKGARVRFDWVIEHFDAPRGVRFKGSGKGGVKAKIDLAIAPTGEGSTVTFTVELGGLPLIGPAGKAAAMATKGDLRESLRRFRETFG
ncbi:type II toxin-antitoxin system Rv0910 family toxin [Gordonia effusa]|uniref:type II toxin-antitoxin system Rv0910 family toxin n=1 Tax=Gordonia effusa TaxID=263908 RepID=UPI0005903AAE|nr:SRPBCC family protein [Gordonia effusa]